MPRPKGAGKTDPRFGRLSSRILDQILHEYDSGQKDRLVRRIQRLQTRAYKLAMKDGGLESFGPNGPMGPPPCLVAAQVAAQIAMAEKVITEIRREEQKIEGAVIALVHSLEDREAGGDEAKNEPMRFVVEVSAPERPKVDFDEE
ncbi:hypothetical protein WMF38_57550 [Sorangium sp. So ce118]